MTFVAILRRAGSLIRMISAAELIGGPIPAPPGVVSNRPCPLAGSPEWSMLAECWRSHRDLYNRRSWGGAYSSVTTSREHSGWPAHPGRVEPGTVGPLR